MRKGLIGARSLCAIALVSGAAFGAAPRRHTPPRRRRPGRWCRPTASGRRGRATTARACGTRRAASASAEWRDPERLLSIRGTVGKLVFSPDSKQLAFENPRGDHAFIAVYDLQGEQDRLRRSVVRDRRAGRCGRPTASRCRSRAASAGSADQPVTAPAPSFGPWNPAAGADQRHVHGRGHPAGADLLRARGVRRRPLGRLRHARGEKPRDLLHALGHAVAPHRQLPRRRRPRALAARASRSAGGAVAYVRDSSPNSDGEILNPGSDVDTPHRLVYVVAVALQRAADARRRAGTRVHAGRQACSSGSTAERDERLADV